MMPDDGLPAMLKGKDAILFGSAGDPHIPKRPHSGSGHYT